MPKNDKKQTIKEWEIEKGIKIINPIGFWGKRNKVWTNKYSERAFFKGAVLSEIVCKTDKGMTFLMEV